MPRGQGLHKFVASAVLIATNTFFSPCLIHGDESSISLDQAVKRSLTTPRVIAAREAINQARADKETAALIPNPELSVEASMFPLSRRFTVEEPGGPPEVSGGISVPIDWLLYGKRSAAMKAAVTAISVAEAEYTDIVRRREAETAEAFYDVIEAAALLDVATQAVKDLDQAETAIRKATSSGGRPQVDLSRVRLELLSARREERSARSTLISMKANLQALIGHVGEAASLQIKGTLDCPLTSKPLTVDAAFSVAVENRPDLMALRNKVTQAHQERIVEGRNAWPETSLSFGVARQLQRSIGAPNATAYGFSLVIALPFFDRNQGGRAKSASKSVQANNELTAALSELHADVEHAVQALNTAYENAMEMTQTDLDLASQLRDSFRKAYEVGGRSLLEMLDAQHTYRETYRVFISTRADYWRALTQYEAVLGKKVLQ